MLGAEWLEQRQLLSTNQITFDAATSAIVIQGTSNAENVHVWSVDNLIHVALTTSIFQITGASFERSSVAAVRFIAGDGDDRFENTTDVPSTVWAGAGNDVLIGGAGNDKLFGSIGDDVLTGNNGADELYGEDGNDHLSGGEGNDRLEGGIGLDRIFGDAGDDQLYGGDDDDQLYGNDGVDRLWGGSGNDRMEGGIGNDRISGSTGDDTLLGNEGDDELYGEDGHDRFWAGDGNDRVEGGIGSDRLYSGAGDDVLLGDEGDDELYGEDGHDRLWGSGGNDRLEGAAGNDKLYGGADDDLLISGADLDELYGEDGHDRLWGGDGNDRLEGGIGNDRISGGTGDDTLIGNEGDNELFGDDGHDRLWGGVDNDRLEGGIGNDRISGGTGDDTLLGNEGDDELYGEDGLDRFWGGSGNDRLEGGIGNDRVYGGIGDDTLVGDEGDDEFYGEDGLDRLWGGVGNDRLEGGIGNDRISGGTGDDTLLGNEGDDELYGEDGVDVLWAGDGNDRAEGGLGNDQVFGGAGDDLLFGDGDHDVVYGNEGNDRLWGADGNDFLDGGTDSDRVSGGIGDDALVGGTSDDELFGDDGDDQLLGGDGNDLLEGAAGHDVAVGGSGADRLTGNADNDLLIGGGDADELLGYSGEDLLIGGMTSYDDDLFQLRVLGLTWAAALPYSLRILQLESESFAAHLVSASTVFEDAVADSLFGGDGQDWFFQTGFMGVHDPNHTHVEEPPSGGDGHQHADPVISDEPPELEGFELVSAIDIFEDRQANEAIHSKLPHADNPTLQREHLTLFQLVRYDQVTHYATVSGAWSDPATWHNGVVPGAGAKVLIPINVEVQVDDVIPTRLSWIRVDGTLSFPSSYSTELRVDTVVVASSGEFEMGTDTAPIAPGVTARLLITNDGPIDRTADPFAIGRGLISHGRVSIHGAEVSSYTALANPALIGEQVLRLEQYPVGWRVGDTIVIASTTAGTAQNEVRHILAIVGNTIVLDQPLAYNHIAPRADLDIHVANVTRNAVIESESTVTARRGHVMFMHNRNVDIAYAGFYRLGRTDKLVPINDSVVGSDWSLQEGTGTNQRARYPVHFHRNGLVNDGNPSVIRGSAVVDATGWGFVNHSSYVDMIGNVAFDVRGAAFATEVGDEIGSFRGNIALGTTGSGQGAEARQAIDDFGHAGDGFWFQGVGIFVTDNISAGNASTAYSFFARAIEGNKEFLSVNLSDPSIAGGAPTIDIGKMPVFQFENNTGYASAEGLATWYLMENADQGQYSYLKNSTFWNNTTGVNLGYTQHTVLEQLTVIHAPEVDPPVQGLRMNSVTTDIFYNNLTVAGYRMGIVLPSRGTSVVNGGDFDNTHDIYIYSGTSRNALISGFDDKTPRIVMAINPNESGSSNFFNDDIVILDFGPFDYQRLYYTQQRADGVPFPTPRGDIPPEYIGLTNQQLWDLYGVALGGAIAPSDAYSVSEIIGLIGPPV